MSASDVYWSPPTSTDLDSVFVQMGLSLSNQHITQELELGPDDAQKMTAQILRF